MIAKGAKQIRAIDSVVRSLLAENPQTEVWPAHVKAALDNVLTLTAETDPEPGNEEDEEAMQAVRDLRKKIKDYIGELKEHPEINHKMALRICLWTLLEAVHEAANSAITEHEKIH